MAYIYQIKNLVNDKSYIGSTIRPLYKRRCEHFSNLRNNKHCNIHLQRAFNKYGEINFKFDILEVFKFPEDYSKLLQLEYLVCRELYLVDLFSSEYNMRLDPTTGKAGYKHSEETKQKISKSKYTNNPSLSTLEKRDREFRRSQGIIIQRGSKKGWTHTVESLEKIRERSNQCDNKLRIREIQKIAAVNRIGKPRSEEVKINMMITKFGKMRQIEIYKDEELLHVCNFSRDAATITGVKRAAISNNLAGLSKSAGGFMFTYKNIN